MARIFISHSHSDEAIAYKLFDFLISALKLDEEDIIFTSDPNSGLSFSSNTISDQLKRNLKGADALVVLITTDSLRSPWIPFEIGSFWPAEKTIVLILGPGLTPEKLPGPFKSWLSICIENDQAFEQFNQVINQLEKKLDIRQNVSRLRRDRYLSEFITRFRTWESRLPASDGSQQKEIEELRTQIQDLESSFDTELQRLFDTKLQETIAEKDYILESYRRRKIKEILKSLYQKNSTTITELPTSECDLICNQIRQDYSFLNLLFSKDSVKIEVCEKEIMNAFSEIWHNVNSALGQNKIKLFRTKVDELTQLLCKSLGFKPLSHSEILGQLYGTMIDASNRGFQLNIRPTFPLIYICKIESSEEDALNISGLLNQFEIFADFFALLVVFNNHQQIRQQLRESPYKNDFIVLDHDQIWEILAAKSPIKQLTKCILEQIDLVAVSPYIVSGPVQEKLFFGRAQEEKTLLQNIVKNDYALIANRKTGKTSLLNIIYPRLKSKPNYQVFYCDLQAVNSYDLFYQELAFSYPEFEEEIGNFSELSPSSFRQLVRNIKQSCSNRRIIFIFDEVDELLAYDLQEREQLFKTFRSLSQRENIRFIFSGTTTLVKRVRHPDSPLFNFCSPIKIGILEEKAAQELVKVPMESLGVKYENEARIVQRILNLTARHPNIIQYICDGLIKIMNEKQKRTITEQDLDRIATSQEFYEYFESLIWGQSTALEKLIVYTMWFYPEFTESQVREDFKKRGIAVDGVKASLEILLTYSTLSKKNDKYFFTFREFARLMEKRRDIKALTEQYQRELGDSEA